MQRSTSKQPFSETTDIYTFICHFLNLFFFITFQFCRTYIQHVTSHFLKFLFFHTSFIPPNAQSRRLLPHQRSTATQPWHVTSKIKPSPSPGRQRWLWLADSGSSCSERRWDDACRDGGNSSGASIKCFNAALFCSRSVVNQGARRLQASAVSPPATA